MTQKMGYGKNNNRIMLTLEVRLAGMKLVSELDVRVSIVDE